MNRLLFATLLLAALVSRAADDPVNAQARARLDKSPRHLEWVTIKQGDRNVKCYIGFPEVKNKATAVVLIHEIFGLSDWVRGVVDQMAEAGYIAIAPDFLSGMGPNGGGTDTFAPDAMRGKIQGLPNDQVFADLDAVVAYVNKLPACNGKVAACGFCWGGGQVFRFATNNKDLKAAFAFYGTGPTSEAEIARINCPVYGFYGGSDMRVNATIPQSTELMKKAGKKYEPVIYEGAGHGFMRAGEDPNDQPKMRDANKKAHDEAWQRMKDILKKL